jgi:hypothetical protein
MGIVDYEIMVEHTLFGSKNIISYQPGNSPALDAQSCSCHIHSNRLVLPCTHTNIRAHKRIRLIVNLLTENSILTGHQRRASMFTSNQKIVSDVEVMKHASERSCAHRAISRLKDKMQLVFGCPSMQSFSRGIRTNTLCAYLNLQLHGKIKNLTKQTSTHVAEQESRLYEAASQGMYYY